MYQPAIMVQHRHDGARIDFQEIGMELFALRQIDMAPLPFQGLFSQHNPHLDGTDGIGTVIKNQHVMSPSA